EAEIKDFYRHFLLLRKDVLKSLEELRNEKDIKSNMEAKVTLCLKETYQNMSILKDVLKQLYIVGKVQIVNDSTNREEYETAYIHSEKFNGVQCPRCWNYYDESEMEGELCHRCHDVINDK